MIRIILALALMLAMASCGDSEKFRISGQVEGNPTINLYYKYYSDGALRQGVTPVEKGKFTIERPISAPGLLVILDNENHALGTIYVKNGDDLSVAISRGNQFKIKAKGTPENERWSACANAASDSLAAGGTAANAAVEAYAAANPGAIETAMMYIAAYDASIDPLRADSVLRAIMETPQTQMLLDGWSTAMARYSDPDIMTPIDTLRFKPYKCDTVSKFTPRAPATLIVFTNHQSQRRDSVRGQLKELCSRKGLEIIDIMLTSDTATWKNAVVLDSAQWTQGWAPGGIYARGIDRLAIPSLPYRIVVDSAGRQIYRGKAHDQAASAIDRLLK